jgi:hypothetical protein
LRHLAVLFHEVTPDDCHVPLWANAWGGFACAAMNAKAATPMDIHRPRSDLDPALLPGAKSNFIPLMSITSPASIRVRVIPPKRII